MCPEKSSSAPLLKQPAEFQRKVIVHELLQLKVPNHGKLFKALESDYLKDNWQNSELGKASEQMDHTMRNITET